MKKIFFLIFPVILILTSCEGLVFGNGKIISSKDSKPIDSVFVYWTNQSYKTTYSDSLGNFNIGSFCGCMPDCPELELLFYKKGYETKYVNFSKEHLDRGDSTIVTMTPTKEVSKEIKKASFEQLLKYFNILISLFNLFTLIMICRVKLKNKALWIISIIIFSITLKYNYYNGEIDISFFSFFLQARILVIYYIGWYLYFIPTTAIIFWAYYFYKIQKSRKLSSNI